MARQSANGAQLGNLLTQYQLDAYQLPDSAELLEQAIAVQRKLLPEEALELANSLLNLGTLEMAAKRL